MREAERKRIGKPRREGQIIKRGKSRFLIRVYLHEDFNGKRIYHNETVKGTRKEAQEHLTYFLHKKNSGKLKEKLSDKNFGEFCEDFFNNISECKERNRLIDLSKIRLYILPRLGHLKLREVTSFHIESLYTHLRQNISKKTNKPLSGTTRNHIHRVLSSVFSYAIRRRLIIDNPLTGVVAPKVDSREMKTLSPDEVTRFLNAVDDSSSKLEKSLSNRIGCLFHLAVEGGLRPEEYFGLKWSDIDFGDLEDGIPATLQIQRVVVRINNRRKFSFDEPKTHCSKRSIPLSDELLVRLLEHRNEIDKFKQVAKEWNEHDLVFPNNKGEPLYIAGVRRLFKKTLKKANVEPSRYRLYDLRHTCATLLLRANVHPKIVSERLGHSSVAITLDVYSHCTQSMQSGATESIAGMIYG